jgi:class 3 adenylate cyclase
MGLQGRESTFFKDERMQPSFRSVTTPDRVSIAYCSQGAGPPLVFVRNWISHIELMWEGRAFRSYFETLGTRFTVIRYDMRSNGLSDRDVGPVDFEQTVVDLESVIDALALDRVILYGQCFGGPTAIAYAARHPERVSHLILDGTYARGDEIMKPEGRERFISTLRDNPEAGLLWIMHLTARDATTTRFRQFELPPAITGKRAAALYELGFGIDVASLLPAIAAPTQVLHRRATRAIPFRLGRSLASAIRHSVFVPLEGSAHNPWDERSADALAAIADFLGVSFDLMRVRDMETARATTPTVIIFTDMESSTPVTQRLGDEAAQEIVRAHDAIVREALRAYDGREIKHTGDGIMASLPSASRAIQVAIDMQRAFASAQLRVRVGLNAGEPMAEGDDLFGTAVQLARRICDAARPGQILVPEAVRHLVAGRGFVFESLGSADLKGFDEPVHLYEVRW